MNKTNIKNKRYLIFVVLVFSLVTFKIYQTVEKNNSLNENSQYTIAKITDKYYVKSKGYYVHYTYIVDLKEYNRSCKVMTDEQKVKIGDKYKVQYSQDEPENSQLIFKERIINE
ncbi:hypothetical protein [Aquimarina sp. AU58]|uniref:hypothetical protein n=1 Tax=Aquimarina sp. AU58 TaxID=1874112 RepID=UPI000D65573E|nr:hypothetical protein [Aquimarina sp. AU58]